MLFQGGGKRCGLLLARKAVRHPTQTHTHTQTHPPYPALPHLPQYGGDSAMEAALTWEARALEQGRIGAAGSLACAPGRTPDREGRDRLCSC